MCLGNRLKIVCLIGMCAHRISKCRVDRGRAKIRPDDRRLRRAAQLPNIVHGNQTWSQARTGYHRSECIEYMLLARDHDRRRQRRLSCRSHVTGKLSRYANILCLARSRRGRRPIDRRNCESRGRTGGF